MKNIDVFELFYRITSAGLISLPEKKLVSSLLKKNHISEEERLMLRRIFYGVNRGLLEVVE